MREQSFIKLLVQIHHSLDRVCEDLDRDRPDLSRALRAHAAWIPRPEAIVAPPSTTSARSVAALRPLLYDALDAGVVDARQFDVLMLERNRAEQILSERRP